jgi:arsenate reductase
MAIAKDVLFVCVHNSARSQMAEEYLRRLSDGRLEVESAGFEPGEINPLVIEALREDGIDISGKTTQSVFELFKRGARYKYVITVCEESEEGKCPIFPGMTHRLHLPFPDPSKLEGTHEEKMAKVREIRGDIEKMMADFLEWIESGEKRKLGSRWERAHIEKPAAE